jgi:hypothetical protein
MENQLKPKKLSNTFIIFIACILGLGIGLLTINYWHTSSCSSQKSADQIDEFIDAFKRRILQAESQVNKKKYFYFCTLILYFAIFRFIAMKY